MNARDTELLALRIATGTVPTDEVEAAVDVLLAEGYRFWVCPISLQLHRVLREPPPSRCPVHAVDFREVTEHRSIVLDALARSRRESMCSTWAIERDGARIDRVDHHHRDEALRAAWVHAAETGRIVGSQTFATMLRPPKGYAIVLVAGESTLPHRFTHEVNPS
jgi:hypothetical protein